jgi:hypothetical protein
MEEVKLQFQTPHDLSAYRKTISTVIKTNIADLQITCKCTKDDIALAMNNFGATVIEKKFIS